MPPKKQPPQPENPAAMQDEAEVTEPEGQCPFCDRHTSTPGHAVVGGMIRSCPNIEFIMTPATPR
jgi:hypothetical protein